LNDYLKDVEETPLLLDVREPSEFAICHVEGAVLMPMRTVPARLFECERDREVVVICHHGHRSMMVARFMEQQGYDHVINLSGGVNAWAREIDLEMPTY
jgi:rhodanese-related sulfurtransferase